MEVSHKFSNIGAKFSLQIKMLYDAKYQHLISTKGNQNHLDQPKRLIAYFFDSNFHNNFSNFSKSTNKCRTNQSRWS